MPKQQPLEYDAHVPAFLQRLKAGHAALDGRHNVQIPRARGNAGKTSRLNMHGEAGEDDPVMLDESGNVVSKEEIEALDTVEKDGKASKEVTSDSMTQEAEDAKIDNNRRVKDESATVNSGLGKKRKVAKVVGGEEEGTKEARASEDDTSEFIKSLKESTKDLHDVIGEGKEQARKEVATNGTTKRGKRKKVKLSFDEPE